MKTRILRRSWALLLAMALAATLLPVSALDPDDAPPTVDRVTLNDTSLTLEVGQTASLDATVHPNPPGATLDDDTVTWKSDREAVATVDSSGQITAIAAGTAHITATSNADNSKSASCTVTVNAAPIPVKEVRMRELTHTMDIGDTKTLLADVLPENATNKTVTWTSSDPDIASVSARGGQVRARKAGTVTITVTTEDGGKEAQCTVTVNAPPEEFVTSITLSPSDFELAIGAIKSLTVSYNPSNIDAAKKEIEWSSDDESIATVANGVVTGVDTGTTKIYAKAKGAKPGTTVEASCTVTVTKPVQTITLDKTTLALKTGDTETLTATVLPADATNKTLTWGSSNPSLVSVDSTGKVTALKATEDGKPVTITAYSSDRKVSATCSVTVTTKLIPVTGITVRKGDDSAIDLKNGVSITAGGSLTLKAVVTPSDANDMELKWTSSNNRLPVSPQRGETVTVTTATANVPVGTKTTITVMDMKTGKQSSPIPVQVVSPGAPSITGVAITSPNTDPFRYVNPGGSFRLAAAITPTNASEKVTWTSSNTAIATVAQDGTVRGVAPGKCVITAEAGGFTDTREVEVSGILLSYLKRSTTGGQGETVNLKSSDIVDIFQYRDISVNTQTFGNAKQKTINWESTNPSVAQATGQGASARVVANYPGDNVTITASVAGTSYSASFKVRVSEDIAQAISINMGADPSLSFSTLLSALNSRSQTKAGAPLESVYNLKVSTKNGTLYYNYTSPSSPGHGVGISERFYYQPSSQGQNALRNVTFVPVAGFSDTAVVDYNATATNGTTFTGTIRIEATATGEISYTTETDQPVAFEAKHFSEVCKGHTGRTIRYVTFEQPASSRGTLYQDYSTSGLYSPKVSSGTRYYATSKPSIDQITFVPAAGYQGDVDITYRCTDSSGASFTGVVTVRVYSADGAQSGNVEYSTSVNQTRDLNGADFNDACLRATDANLNYITFTSLPSTSAGRLYVNYTNSSSTRVSTGTRYYRNSSPLISNLTFVPASGYSGTVSIPFTGTNTSGTSFTGNLIIHVGNGAGTVHYSTPRNQSVSFNAADFNDACRNATGDSLNYVRFTDLPSSSAGTLYSGYSSASSTGSRVSTGTDYRRTGTPSLSNITFVPANNYTGTVSIPFTGYDVDGDRFSGTVTVTVGQSSGRLISYTVPANGSVRFSASDFNSACRSATGDSLNYVRFDSSSTSYGTLYYQYNTTSRTGTSLGSGTSYYYSGGNRLISDVSFAANATAGTASIGYTGYSSRGDSFTGTVEVRVNASASTGATSSGIYYSGSSTPISFYSTDFQNACQSALGAALSSVQFNSLPASGRLYRNYTGPGGAGTGVTSSTRYGVQDLDQISYVPKAEYQGQITIPYTAYDVQGGSHTGTVNIQLSSSYCNTSFSDVAYGWDWAKPSIEFLRHSGITNGYSNNTFRPGQQISRGEFTLMICRAFQFSTSGSSGFPDVPANSVYAGAIGTARDLGIVQGNNGRFQPDRPITRQSAMTMICRAMDAAGQTVPSASTSLLSDYSDGSQVSSFARSSVASLIQLGAVRGTQDMRLNPTAAISRAEMAVILHRVLAQ